MDIDAGEAVFRGRFGATHFIESIPTRGRNVADWQPFIYGRSQAMSSLPAWTSIAADRKNGS